MGEDNDFGFSYAEAWDMAMPEINDLRERLEKLKDAIWPFLDNLAKNPEKDIHWPDRDVRIAEFKKKLQDIVDGKP